MVHDITVTGINGNQPFKGNSLSWKRDVDNFCDTATVKLPALAMLKKKGESYERVQTGLQFKEGMPIEIKAGYDDTNLTRFKGFISRINFSIPLVIECEGYSYPLRKKLNFNFSAQNTTVKALLAEVIKGTDIKLSSAIPDIPLNKVTFKNCTAIQALEWLKEKCLLTVHFIFDTLYCGLEQVNITHTKNFRLNWNVIKDDELKFNSQKEFADVRIVVGSRKADGTKALGETGKKDGQVKSLNTVITDPVSLARIAKQKKSELLNKGYEGSITAFLLPPVEPGYAANITDAKYPDRTGKYFITGIEGEFSTSGGRQKIKIGNAL